MKGERKARNHGSKIGVGSEALGKTAAKKSMKTPKKKPRMSMTLQILCCLAGFTLVAGCMAWIVQVLISDSVYGNVKRREMKTMANLIVNHISDENIEKKIATGAEKYNICIRVFSVSKGTLTTLTERYSAIVFANNTIEHLPEKTLKDIYNSAVRNGGSYEGNFGINTYHPTDDRIDSAEGGFVNNPDNFAIGAVSARVFSDEHGNEYMVLLNAIVTPLAAARKTFGAQFSYIIILLVVGVSAFSFLLSTLVSKPLKRITAEAKQLAEGNYNVNFSERGYREINELSDTLNYAASELGKNDRLQKELIANISHDLRTPLTMIKGYGEIMRDIPGENTPQNIQIIIDETTRLSELVNDLLDISKLESDTGHFAPEVFNLTESVQAVIGRYEKMNAMQGFDIHFVADDDVSVYADNRMILQVIYNLINNAINYCGEDHFVGVEQRCFTTASGLRKVRISVTDHGKGIEKSKLPMIWERYYKVNENHRRATVGSGLGLSIVRKIMEKHESAYGVESTIGKGSTFWFELVVVDPTP